MRRIPRAAPGFFNTTERTGAEKPFARDGSISALRDERLSPSHRCGERGSRTNSPSVEVCGYVVMHRDSATADATYRPPGCVKKVEDRTEFKAKPAEPFQALH